LGRPAFPYATTNLEVELAIVSVAELGLDAEASSYSEVYARAKRIGLELCPAEVGPRLRLDYRDQPLGEALDIAMEPVATYGGDPTILALVNFGSALALIGSDGRSGAMMPRSRRFVFALPARRLEARRDIELYNSLTRARVIAGRRRGDAAARPVFLLVLTGGARKHWWVPWRAQSRHRLHDAQHALAISGGTTRRRRASS